MFRKNVRKGRTTTRSTDDEMVDWAGEVFAEVLVVVTKISPDDELDVRLNYGCIYSIKNLIAVKESRDFDVHSFTQGVIMREPSPSDRMPSEGSPTEARPPTNSKRSCMIS